MNKKQNEDNVPMNTEVEHKGKYFSFKLEKQKEIFIIDQNYSDFPSFYSEVKGQIYRKIFETYEKVLASGKKEMNLIVTGYINDEPFNTEFIIDKTDPSLLIKVINPYFESIEDYETCGKITQLYNSLRSN
jgi:hypothetical protein